MKLLSAFFLFAFVAFAYALTVEEAWETYKVLLRFVSIFAINRY